MSRIKYRNKVFVSDELRKAVKEKQDQGLKNFSLAHAINDHPSWLSKVLNRALKVAPDDRRILELGRILNIPAERCTTKKPSE